jgi:hypothetical protein
MTEERLAIARELMEILSGMIRIHPAVLRENVSARAFIAQLMTDSNYRLSKKNLMRIWGIDLPHCGRAVLLDAVFAGDGTWPVCNDKGSKPMFILDQSPLGVPQLLPIYHNRRPRPGFLALPGALGFPDAAPPVRDLKAENAGLRSDLDASRAEAERLRGRVAELERAARTDDFLNITALADLRSVREERDRVCARIPALEAEVAALRPRAEIADRLELENRTLIAQGEAHLLALTSSRDIQRRLVEDAPFLAAHVDKIFDDLRRASSGGGHCMFPVCRADETRRDVGYFRAIYILISFVGENLWGYLVRFIHFPVWRTVQRWRISVQKQLGLLGVVFDGEPEHVRVLVRLIGRLCLRSGIEGWNRWTLTIDAASTRPHVSIQKDGSITGLLTSAKMSEGAQQFFRDSGRAFAVLVARFKAESMIVTDLHMMCLLSEAPASRLSRSQRFARRRARATLALSTSRRRSTSP